MNIEHALSVDNLVNANEIKHENEKKVTAKHHFICDKILFFVYILM